MSGKAVGTGCRGDFNSRGDRGITGTGIDAIRKRGMVTFFFTVSPEAVGAGPGDGDSICRKLSAVIDVDASEIEFIIIPLSVNEVAWAGLHCFLIADSCRRLKSLNSKGHCFSIASRTASLKRIAANEGGASFVPRLTE